MSYLHRPLGGGGAGGAGQQQQQHQPGGNSSNSLRDPGHGPAPLPGPTASAAAAGPTVAQAGPAGGGGGGGGGGPSTAGRLNDLLDFVKAEFEGVAGQVDQCKRENAEYSVHAQSHLDEVSTFRRELSELEREHSRAKMMYEDKIADLKRQIEMLKAQNGQGPAVPTVVSATTNHFGTLMGYPNGLFNQAAGGHQQPLNGAANGFRTDRDRERERERERERDRDRDRDSMAIDEPISAHTSRQTPGTDILGKRARPEDSHYEGPSYKTRVNLDGRPVVENGVESRTASAAQFPPRPPSRTYAQSPAHHHGATRPASPMHAQLSHPPQHPPSQEPSVLAQPPTTQQDTKPPAPPLSLAPPSTSATTAPSPSTSTGKTASSPANQPHNSSLQKHRTSTPSVEDPQHQTLQQQHPSQAAKLGTPTATALPSGPKKPDWDVYYYPRVKKVLDVTLLHTFLHESVVCCVRISPDGKTLATGCNRITTLYDTASGREVAQLPDESSGAHNDNYIRSVAFSPDGKLLVTGSEDQVIRIWNIESRSILKKLVGHESEIYSLAFTPDGKDIVSGSGDRTARLWSIETGSLKHAMTIEDVASDSTGQAHDGGVTSVAISPDGKLLAAGSLDHIVRIWDLSSGKLLDKLKGHSNSVYSVAFIPSPAGKSQLLTGSLDKTLKVWDLQPLVTAVAAKTAWDPNAGKTQCTQSLTGHKDYVLSVATSGDGNWVASGSKDRAVQFFDLRTGQPHFALHGHKNSVISIAMSETGGLLATGSGDWQARVFRVTGLDHEVSGGSASVNKPISAGSSTVQSNIAATARPHQSASSPAPGTPNPAASQNTAQMAAPAGGPKSSDTAAPASISAVSAGP